MEHKVGNRKLQRTTSHRLAMLKNMVTSLLRHEQIKTTPAKAKEARRWAEHMITLGKKGGLHNIRLAERSIKDREVLKKLFGELKTRYEKRAGGYTRIIRAGFRRGDAAEQVLLQLVDRPVVEAPAAAEAAAPAAPATK